MFFLQDDYLVNRFVRGVDGDTGSWLVVQHFPCPGRRYSEIHHISGTSFRSRCGWLELPRGVASLKLKRGNTDVPKT